MEAKVMEERCMDCSKRKRKSKDPRSVKWVGGRCGRCHRIWLESNRSETDPGEPVEIMPGTEDKVRVLEERFAARQPLFLEGEPVVESSKRPAGVIEGRIRLNGLGSKLRHRLRKIW